MSELAELLEGGNCSDIVEGKIKGKIEIDSQRHEEDDKGMVKRVKIKDKDRAEKVTPIEYLSVTGEVPKLDQIQVLKPENLTKEDAISLINAGCTRKHLADLYGMSVGKLYSLLTQFGLHTPKKKIVDKPVDTSVDTVEPDSNEKEPTSAIAAPELKLDSIIWLDPFKPQPRITISNRSIVRINCSAVESAPSVHRQGCKARIGIDRAQKLIIQPVADISDGYTFRLYARAISMASKQVAKSLKDAGISIPAVFDATWDEGLQAWVGQLVQEKQQEAI